MPKSAPTNLRPLPQARTPEAIYEYRDAKGAVLFEKVRFAGKEFSFRYGHAGKYYYRKPKTDEARFALYGWEKASQIIKAGREIIICEGEKDVDALRARNAVTNDSGAANWKKEHSQQLKGASEVIILEDNDEAGRKRTEQIRKTLQGIVENIFVVKFEMLPEHGDVKDWIDLNPNLDPFDFIKKNKQRLATEKDSEKKEVATYRDFISLFESQFGTLRRDIFDGSVMFLDKHGEDWRPIDRRQEQVLKSLCVQSPSKIYKSSLVESHLAFLENSLTPEFLIDVPLWDKVDRVAHYCSAITLDKASGISWHAFYFYIKEFLVNMMRRITEYKTVQPKIIILAGKQDKGKDTWILNLVGGLGQFTTPLSIELDAKDLYLQVCQCLCVTVSEFDRVMTLDASKLKDLITTPSTYVRSPYDRKPRLRPNRASWLASANTNGFLKDPTGNRRFVIFDVEAINFDYPTSDNDKLQILAQAQHYLSTPWWTTEEAQSAKDEMQTYIEEKTPENIEDLIAEFWVELAAKHLNSIMDPTEYHKWNAKGWLPNNPYASEILEKVRQQLGLRSVKTIRDVLKRKGYSIRTETDRGYLLSV